MFDTPGRDQRSFSERLQLLHILDNKPTVDSSTEEFNLSKLDKVELKIVDNIAYFLASRSTDVVAVTLRKTLPLTFVLAKNRGMPDETDIATAKAFFHNMRDASSWRDVMPCIIFNGAERINTVLAALSAFQFENILPGETQYVPGELHEEFTEGLAERFADLFRTRETLEILKGLFHRVRDRASFEVDPNRTASPDELNAQLDKFILVTATAECLLLTKFFKEKIKEAVDWALEYRTRVRQVTRYIQGLSDLISIRRRFIVAGSDIHYAWLQDALEVEVEQERTVDRIELSDSPLTAIQNLAESLTSYQPISSDEYRANPKSSGLEEQWIPAVRPIRHLVPRMVTYLDKDPFYKAHPRLIGTSSQLCLCCARWLTNYNYSGGWHIKWMASNPVHRVDIGADWGFIDPGASTSSSRTDIDVYEMVSVRVTRVLEDVGLLREVSEVSALGDWDMDPDSADEVEWAGISW